MRPRLILVLLVAVLLSNPAYSAGTLLVETVPPEPDLDVTVAARSATTDHNGLVFFPDLAAGRHEVHIRGSGWTYRGDVEIKDGLGQTLSATLRKGATPSSGIPARAPLSRERAPLTIDANVGGADVYIDGNRVSQTDGSGAARINLTPGSHEIEVRAVGFRSWSKTVTLSGGLDNLQTVHLRPAQTSRSWMGPVIGGLVAAIVFAVGAIAWFMRPGARRKQRSFGHFELRGELGTGGMATLYRARNKRTKQIVALKVMNTNLVRDADLIRRFLQEGAILRQLNTEFPQAPIVRVHEFAGEDGRNGTWPYLALELLEGETLQACLARSGALPIAEAVRILEQILLAVAAAHGVGVYHRDLTPDNIMLGAGSSAQRWVRLIDFGVAKHEFVSHHTMDGSVMGKPPFMAPEQLRGQRVSGKTDIYSTGMIIYNMVEGAPPFVSTNPMEVMRLHERQIPAPLDGKAPAWLVSLVSEMVQKNPEHRPDADAALKVVRANGAPGAPVAST